VTVETKIYQLRDGRRLAYTEHGDLTGKPVIFIHGNPGSRLMRHPDESMVESLGIRMITPDRPGYGFSDFQPRRTARHFPDDMAQLADALEIEEFAVMGVSAGGPYVMACAHDLRDRVTKAAMVSTVSPLNRENAFEGMHETYRAAFQTAQSVPNWMARALVWIQVRRALKDPMKTLVDVEAILSNGDKRTLSNMKIREQVANYRVEAARNGSKGVAREIRILVSPWGFSLENIETPVDLWYWEDDVVVPQQMGWHLQDHLPNVTGHFLAGGGHFSIFDHWRQILESLISE
jgi:pimeloyl-ACP methyl ester carboxylesterase